MTRRHDGDQCGLIVAALALSLSVDRHGHHDLGTGPGPGPATADGRSKGFREAPLAAIFQVVEGMSHGAGERRAPFQLEQGSWQVYGHPDR